MSNLADDTEVIAADTGGDQAQRRYQAQLSRDWAMWGPNGGYLAAIALRAAAAASPGSRPSGMSCQFVSVAEFDSVDLLVTRQRRSRRVELQRVRMTQGDTLILDAHVSTVNPDTATTSRQWFARPDAPGPEGLKDMTEIVRAEGGSPLPLWRNYEVRPAQPLDRAPDRPARDPHLLAWVRFRDPPTFPDDPWLDACRHLIAIDIAGFPAATQGFAAEELTFIAPNLDLQVAFHEADPHAEWLLVEARALAVGAGLCGARADIWSPTGPLLSTGSQQMLLTSPRRG